MILAEKMPFFVLILGLSLLNNLLVPFWLYFRKFGRRGYQGQGGCNGWGVLMDGVWVAFLNLVAVNFLLEAKLAWRWPEIFLSFCLGLLAMVLMHVWMSLKRWEGWIMPKPWKWNSGGYWHMISATLQIGFLFYPLVLIWKNPVWLSQPLTQLTLLAGALGALLFFLSLSVGRRGLKTKFFQISHRSW